MIINSQNWDDVFLVWNSPRDVSYYVEIYPSLCSNLRDQ